MYIRIIYTYIEHYVLYIMYNIYVLTSLYIIYIYNVHTYKLAQTMEITHPLKVKSCSSHRGSAVMKSTSIHEKEGTIPGLDSGLRIRCCCELWCRLQMRIRTLIAVAVVQTSSCSSDSTRTRKIPYATGSAPKSKKKKERKNSKVKSCHF